jgi:hypothetical protein
MGLSEEEIRIKGEEVDSKIELNEAKAKTEIIKAKQKPKEGAK